MHVCIYVCMYMHAYGYVAMYCTYVCACTHGYAYCLSIAILLCNVKYVAIYISFLFMHVAPPEITAEPNQYVLRGNDAILACNFSADPSPKVVWRRNGSIIGDNETVKYSIPHKGLLKIANATEEDAGIYRCTATNNRGSDDFDITLTILSKLVTTLY